MKDKDPFYKRSSFGSLLFFVGVALIFWLVDGKVPTSQDWIEGLVLLLTVFGYQAARPTAPADTQYLKRADKF